MQGGFQVITAGEAPQIRNLAPTEADEAVLDVVVVALAVPASPDEPRGPCVGLLAVFRRHPI